MLVLGIESSCDDAAAAVIETSTPGIAEIRSSTVANQDDIHRAYGGIVPELASRNHVVTIAPVIERALDAAGCRLADVEGIAVTRGPGLVGSLLVGLMFAKGLAHARGVAMVGVNHIEGHLLAPLLENRIAMPYLALVVSGGHTALFAVEDFGRYRRIGRTRDDAAGEAFDKVAKLLGLGYPGGPIIDRLAPHGDPTAVKFLPAQIKHRDRRDRKGQKEAATTESDRPRFDFSYSGIKTAVLRYVEIHDMHRSIEARRQALTKLSKPKLEDYLANCDRQTLDLVASFQRATVEDLVSKTLAAARACDVATLFVTGGVAANNELRSTFERDGAQDGLPVYFPSRPLSTDNAAMIAAAAYPKFLAKDFASMDFSAEAGMVLR
jgi:N6-L-threonylcarbamoyladenine synthase